jgi:PRTRC genetic system protein D
MIVGIDIGYSHTKIAVNSHAGIFPSVVGSPERASFSLDDIHRIALETSEGWVQVGESVLDQSRFISRPEDRGWISSQEYYWLYLSALSESTTSFYVDNVTIVTGLPLAYYRQDQETLRDIMAGDHQVKREGRKVQSFCVTEVRVLPQPFGSLLSAALGPSGNVIDPSMLSERVGIVDIGGHTTNLLSAVKAHDIDRETGSVDMGAWDVVRSVREALGTIAPRLKVDDYEIVEAIKAKSILYFGEILDLTDIVEDSLAHFRRQVLAEASHLWSDGANLAAILVSGGGAHLIGPAILDHFRAHKNVRVVESPVFANAIGYVRFGRYLKGGA